MRMSWSIAFSLVLKDDDQAPPWVARIRAAGFHGVEPTFGLESTLPTATDPRASAEKLALIAQKEKLKIPSVRGGPGFWPTFASSDPAQRRVAVDLATKAMEALQILGGDTLLIVPGQWEPHQTYSEVWTSALDTARRIVPIAEKLNIDVALENVENRFLLSPREWMQFLDEVGSPRVRMYFDVGNVIYMRLGYPEQWLRELGRKYIRRIHFKDATPGQVAYLLEGQVNWATVSNAIRDIGYNDWIGVELNLPAHRPEAMLAGTYRAAEAILK
jgi:hexulose-6-phosphate isomerase